MNYRALALGAAIGFVFALSPSCSPDPTCNATNCAGCCDTTGTCQSATATTCGASGNACVACPANQTCTGGTCTSSTGGGGGGGGGSTCDGFCPTLSGGCGTQLCRLGCCIADDVGTCRQTPDQNFCGKSGATCGACSAGQTCENVFGGTECKGTGGGAGGGTGTVTDAGIGTPCTANVDCGDGFACKQLTTDLTDGGTYTTYPDGGPVIGVPYPGGYCTRACANNNACGGGGNICLTTGVSGESERLCTRACTPKDNNTCREGYACLGLQGGAAVCFPDPAFTPGQIGGPCVRDEDCGSNVSASCAPATTSTALATGFSGGYCTGYCSAALDQGRNDFCGGPGTTCVNWRQISPQYEAQCYSTCANPDGGTLNTRGTIDEGCRAGQLCWDLYSDTDDTGLCAGDCRLATTNNKGCQGAAGGEPAYTCVETNLEDGGRDPQLGMCCQPALLTDGGLDLLPDAGSQRGSCYAFIP